MCLENRRKASVAEYSKYGENGLKPNERVDEGPATQGFKEPTLSFIISVMGS